MDFLLTNTSNLKLKKTWNPKTDSSVPTVQDGKTMVRLRKEQILFLQKKKKQKHTFSLGQGFCGWQCCHRTKPRSTVPSRWFLYLVSNVNASSWGIFFIMSCYLVKFVLFHKSGPMPKVMYNYSSQIIFPHLHGFKKSGRVRRIQIGSSCSTWI